MKRNIKHRFAHKDPEKEIIRSATKKDQNKEASSKETEIENLGLIKKDLKRTVVTILVFVVIVIALYLVEQKFELISIISNKLEQ